MYPVLLGSGAWSLPSYFTLLLLAFLLGTFLVRQEAMRRGWNHVRVVDLCLWLLVVSILGARVAHVLFDGFLLDYIALCRDPSQLALALPSGSACQTDAQCLAAQRAGTDIGALCIEGLCQPERDCWRVLAFWSGGLTFYGGFLAALVLAYCWCRREHWSFLALGDMASAPIALGLAIGRLGCFMAGCCFGKVTDLPWGVQFPQYSDAWLEHHQHHQESLAYQTSILGQNLSLPVHPTQLYELSAALGIFLYLWFYRRKRLAFEGQALSFLLMAYAVARFAIEIFRDDARGGYILSTSQWISLPCFALGFVLMWRGLRQAKRGVERV